MICRQNDYKHQNKKLKYFERHIIALKQEGATFPVSQLPLNAKLFCH
jgi:hypothetical protein